MRAKQEREVGRDESGMYLGKEVSRPGSRLLDHPDRTLKTRKLILVTRGGVAGSQSSLGFHKLNKSHERRNRRTRKARLFNTEKQGGLGRPP